MIGLGQREQERLEALARYDVLDTPREEAFDRITRLVRKIFDVPMAVVSLIDGHRQWHKACDGLVPGEAPRQDTFCTYTIAQEQPVIVPDALKDPRFAANPYVVGAPHVRFYAGIPLRTDDGHNIGTLCAIDVKPRELTPDQIELLSDLARIAMDELELRRLAMNDGLTGALSRRAFKETAQRECQLAQRHHHELSCVTLDLDHFKSINDRYGHAFGDTVLAQAVASCARELRDTDYIGRLGGEEFAVLLPHTPKSGALDVAEKLRRAVGNLTLESGTEPVRVTASFGVAALDPKTRDGETLLQHADLALYEAKAAGRNRCVLWVAETENVVQRRRVLKGGQIRFNDHTSSIDCTVRSLSEDGAGIDVYTSVGIPKRFDLCIRADGLERHCRVISQTEKHIEVEFLPVALLSNGSRLHH
jgi:diguanylate cyclase (GGDEF)-like protein